MIELTEPQVWTLIGVFAAAMFGMVGLVTSRLRREIQGLRNEMVAKFDSMDSRFDQLDRDVQFLMRKEFD